MIEPPDPARMSSATARASRIGAAQLTSIMRRIVSGSTFSASA
jgi:hypothetical protein